MDALKLLKQDHEKVEELFDEVCELSERAHKQRRMLADRICDELEVHATVEEKIFYPSVRNADEEVGDLVLESFEEHALVKKLVSEIRHTEESDERFMAKIKVLREMVMHHVEEEQDELFPKVKKAMEKRQLEEMGERIEQMKMRPEGEVEEMPTARLRLRRRARAGNGASATR